MLGDVYLVHSEQGAATGATPCSRQYAGLLRAFQWLHTYPHPKPGQLSSLHITGICAKEHLADLPGKLCSVWKWSVCWSSETFSLGSIEVNLAEILPNFSVWLLLILSFWYCHGVCYLCRIRLILVRCG